MRRARADIRCDLQMHSDWSDGGQTLEEIIETGLARGYTHSAVTDHSYGLPIAGGLSMARVEQQHREIDRAEREIPGSFRLLKGIEANIRADGSVDMTPRGAGADGDRRCGAALGAAIVGRSNRAHARRGADAGRAHPRPPARPHVRIAARRHAPNGSGCSTPRRALGVAIELDGDPSRQDLDYDLARRAIPSGCLFAIDSDAHATDQWWYAETALAHARLAGVPRDRVINCWPLARLLDWAQHRSLAA